MKRILGTFALALAAFPISSLVAPAISRADDCAPGWVWSPTLN